MTKFFKATFMLVGLCALGGFAIFFFETGMGNLEPVITAAELSERGISEALTSDNHTENQAGSIADANEDDMVTAVPASHCVGTSGDTTEFASVYFQDVIDKYYSKYSLVNSVLPDFEDQVFCVNDAEDPVSSHESGTMTFSCDGNAHVVFKHLAEEMRSHGWVETSSGYSGMSTFSREGEGYTWAILSCAEDLGNESSSTGVAGEQGGSGASSEPSEQSNTGEPSEPFSDGEAGEKSGAGNQARTIVFVQVI